MKRCIYVSVGVTRRTPPYSQEVVTITAPKARFRAFTSSSSLTGATPGVQGW
jgi:hypothetical protein